MLNCQDAQKRLPGHAFDALAEEEAAHLDRHLADCHGCRAELEQVRARLGLLAEWSEPEPPADLAARTVEKLRGEPVRLSWWKRLDQALGRFASRRLTPTTGLAAVAVTVMLLVPVLSPNWNRARSSGALTGCRANLRLLSKALDRYAGDHQGRYPTRLSDLHPQYVRQFPECPSAGRNTYLSGYAPGSDGRRYSVACQGAHHRDEGVFENEPRIGR